MSKIPNSEIVVGMDTDDFEAGNEVVNQELTRTGLTIERLTMLQEHMAASMALSTSSMILSVSGLSAEYKELGMALQVVGQISNMLFMIERMRLLQKRLTIATNAEEAASNEAVAVSEHGRAAASWEAAAAGTASNLWLAPLVASIIALAVASVYALSRGMAAGGAGIASEGETFRADAGESYWFGGKNNTFPFPGGGMTAPLIVQGNVYGVDDLVRILNEHERRLVQMHGGLTE